MTAVIHFLQAHAYWAGIGTLWVFSALTYGMPEPKDSSSTAYRWAYGSLHLLASNLANVAKAKGIPVPEQK